MKIRMLLSDKWYEERRNWRDIPTHEVLKQEARVTLAECPEVLQSIGPSAKLFSAKFKMSALMKMSSTVKNIHLWGVCS